MTLRRFSCVCAFGMFLSSATAGAAQAGEGSATSPTALLDRVRALARTARTNLIVAGLFERTAPTTALPSEPEAALNELEQLLESEGMKLLDGPVDMRVAVQREHALAWPTHFPESPWVRDRCQSREPLGVHFGIVGVQPRDIANAAAHLTGTEFADKQVIPARGTFVSILSDQWYSLNAGCQVYEAALLLVGFEIEERGGVFTIRRTR